ncbi:MAG: ATP-binding cassette domain-containing protein, partial [Lachnospiraceae bacterium]|nr:ATP-binding cassette domain-containing protein [Lachnospiraceae bacterium]
MSDYRIKADNLVKTFTKNEKKNKKVDINAVDGISLTVNEGEIVGILGPNGAGKTTLLRMMSKLMKPTSGQVSIRIGEKEITDDIEVKRHIGYLSNNTKLYGRFS